jgi:aminoglycoside phosphotransferase (APT) family kinase protein
VAAIPPAEVDIDAALVSRLLGEQAPDLATLPVARFAHGWDNEMFTLGPDLLVRLPRRQDSAGLIEHEADALPRLAARLPVPVPVPRFVGGPGCGFPWRWTVVPRLPGRSAADVGVGDRAAAASDLAAFLVALHVAADADAPANPFRGVPLGVRAEAWTPRIRACVGTDGLARWLRWSAAPGWPGPPVWLHGDLHPMNLLLRDDGALAGVVDFGDVCSGDPAGDLSVAWLMFDDAARREFRAACRLWGTYDEAVWARAWAWAVGLASVFAHASDDSPALAAIARHGLEQTMADPEFGAAG